VNKPISQQELAEVLAMSSKELLDRALEHVESESIRAWVLQHESSWLSITESWQARQCGGFADPVRRLAVFIMCHALGA
jgi:hypothetical protein